MFFSLKTGNSWAANFEKATPIAAIVPVWDDRKKKTNHIKNQPKDYMPHGDRHIVLLLWET